MQSILYGFLCRIVVDIVVVVVVVEGGGDGDDAIVGYMVRAWRPYRKYRATMNDCPNRLII